MPPRGSPTRNWSMPEPVWTARGSSKALRAVRPLIDAHARFRPVEVFEEDCCGRVEFSACGLTGSVPEDPRLTQFAEAAAVVCSRSGRTGPVALLAQWDERAFHLAKEGRSLAPSPLFWPAHVITGRDLPAALGVGLGACVYFGHGHAGGWDGYCGIDARTLAAGTVEPMGAVLSVTCQAAKRPKRGLSFCEELVLSGYCAASFGSIGRSSHRRNARLGLALCQAMRDHDTLAGIIQNCNASWLSLAAYRIFGDPLARLAGAQEAAGRARAIESGFFTPAGWIEIR